MLLILSIILSFNNLIQSFEKKKWKSKFLALLLYNSNRFFVENLIVKKIIMWK